MSRQGDVGGIAINRHHAAVVGALFESRLNVYNLEGTALAMAPAFGRKLQSAAKRKGQHPDRIRLWSVSRPQALSGFHVLALFSHPDVPEDYLTNAEWEAVRHVRTAVASALLARRGPKKLERLSVERRLQNWKAGATRETDPDPADERFMRRLRRRVAAQDAVRATSLNSVPPFLLRMLAPRRISR